MKLSKGQIREISQDLQTGLVTYINRETYEAKSILARNDIYSDSEFWEEELEKIENEWTDVSEIKKMESWEAFQILDFRRKIERRFN